MEASVWRGGDPRPAAVATVEGEASVALPSAVSRVLREARLELRTLAAAAICDGPGSVLGIRLSAASLRAWRVAAHGGLACYSFHSLPLLAVALRDRESGGQAASGAAATGSATGATVVADARRESWHAARSGAPHELLRLPSADLATEARVVTPTPFRRWSAPPAGVVLQEHEWSVAALLAGAPDEAFFQDSPEPEAFLTEAPSYAAWTPRVHQAPAATGK